MDIVHLAALVTLAQQDDDRTPSLADAVQQWCGHLQCGICFGQRVGTRQGVGPGLRLPGFSSRRRAVGGAAASELTLQVVL